MCNHAELVDHADHAGARLTCAQNFSTLPKTWDRTVLFPAPRHGSSPPRAVITGAGIVTALGQTWKANAEGFRAGRLATRPVTLFDVSRQRVKMAAEVDLPATLPKTRLALRDCARMDRAAKLLLIAAHQAWEQSGWEPSQDLPVVLGTTSGGMSLG